MRYANMYCDSPIQITRGKDFESWNFETSMTHDQEYSCEQDGFDSDVQVEGEVYAEIVRVGKSLSSDARPLFCHLANLCPIIG